MSVYFFELVTTVELERLRKEYYKEVKGHKEHTISNKKQLIDILRKLHLFEELLVILYIHNFLQRATSFKRFQCFFFDFHLETIKCTNWISRGYNSHREEIRKESPSFSHTVLISFKYSVVSKQNNSHNVLLNFVNRK
jgi:hypothetical protein